MKICGIIVEYNPLHNGHVYHLNQVKKISGCDLLIAVMSGNFVQRGQPSLISKEIRTKLALQAGVDVVVELPYLYAVSHADLFSLGAISILNHCGVDEIIFGSESNDSSTLLELATKIDHPHFNELLKSIMNDGYSYPEACSKALKIITNKNTDLLANDLLGIQYIRNILHINKNIAFKTIKRRKSNYNDQEILHEEIASATSIRKALMKKENVDHVIPDYTKQMLNKTKLHYWNDYFPYLKYQITSQKHALKEIHDINEGIENAMIQHIKKETNYNQFVSSLVSKRYTKGKIQRLLTHVLNHVTKEEVQKWNIWNGPQYVRILGFKEKKTHDIKQLKKTSQVPIITNKNRNNHNLLKIDLRASEIYHLVDCERERKIPIIYPD
ncbi:nucleotidyltransferase [Mycoplasmatota bacterium]|nr:nucleotidyltransferase [Mycoplasmatota bacterium]